MKYSVIMSNYKQLPYLIANKAAWDRQTYNGEYEVIVASDEDDQAVLDWCDTHVDKYVYQVNKGYRLSHILNKAVAASSGQYVVFVMGDSYPKDDFLTQLDFAVKPERVVNGIRLNVNESGTIVSSDWRVSHFDQMETDEQLITLPHPWRAMTLNGQVMSKALYEKIGGMYEGYTQYGREDWDLNMRAFFDGAEMWWCNTAIIYHREHTPKDDAPGNIALFEKRLKEIEAKTLVTAKEKLIRDPKRAEKRYAELKKRLSDQSETYEE